MGGGTRHQGGGKDFPGVAEVLDIFRLSWPHGGNGLAAWGGGSPFLKKGNFPKLIGQPYLDMFSSYNKPSGLSVTAVEVVFVSIVINQTRSWWVSASARAVLDHQSLLGLL